ncbi:MAG: hypothetical protein ACYTBP_07670, partial [Planctomycetota bacterium]
VLFSLPLFWGRFFSEFSLIRHILRVSMITISPSRLLPDEIENDPNVTHHSRISISVQEGALFSTLGIADYFNRMMLTGPGSNIFHYNNNQRLYFDKRTGLAVSLHEAYTAETGKEYAALYAGPNGISQSPGEALGRFENPVAYMEWGFTGEYLFLYDKKMRRFFRINFRDETVVKGPEISSEENYDPVQVGRLSSTNMNLINLHWQLPREKVLKKSEDSDSVKESLEKIALPYILHGGGPYIPVLDASGRIDLLDREGLDFAGPAGFLLGPDDTAVVEKTGYPKPKDVLSYNVLPVTIFPQGRENPGQYRGLLVSCLNREGSETALGVFNSSGKPEAIKFSEVHIWDQLRGHDNRVSTRKAIYTGKPGAPLCTVLKYLFENLHPPILSELSYWTANLLDASSNGSSLFLMPNSFIAMKARKAENFFSRLIEAIFLMSPAIILSVWLTIRVNKDACKTGLCENAKTLWIVGTICFGLVAYITYRLTRPGITLVTCQNCGNPRRPDMEHCHHCKSKWLVPELEPPLWRVTDMPSN